MNETRATIIERENSDPEIMARKEKFIEELLAKWESWGIIKFKDNTPENT